MIILIHKKITYRRAIHNERTKKKAVEKDSGKRKANEIIMKRKYKTLNIRKGKLKLNIFRIP